MNNHGKKIKLTEKDKRILLKNINICTDTYGNGCTTASDNSKVSKLN